MYYLAKELLRFKATGLNFTHLNKYIIIIFVMPLVMARTKNGHPVSSPILNAKAMVEISIRKIN
jgi:hypothetical protein